jgi:hypothetical protein
MVGGTINTTDYDAHHAGSEGYGVQDLGTWPGLDKLGKRASRATADNSS